MPTVQYIAAKALIKNSSEQVLVLRQSDQTISGGGRCHPPGGILELGETLEQCVVREVQEETGVACRVVRFVDVGEWQAQRGDDIMQFVGLYYECVLEDGGLRLQESEVGEALWVGLDTIETTDIMEPSKSIIRKFLLQEGFL